MSLLMDDEAASLRAEHFTPRHKALLEEFEGLLAMAPDHHQKAIELSLFESWVCEQIARLEQTVSTR